MTPSDELLRERVSVVLGDQSVTQFAKILGLNHESVRRYVRGQTTIPATFLVRIVERYAVDGHWLLAGSDIESDKALRTVETSRLLAEVRRRADLALDTTRLAAGSELEPWAKAALLSASSMVEARPASKEAATEK